MFFGNLSRFFYLTWRPKIKVLCYLQFFKNTKFVRIVHKSPLIVNPILSAKNEDFGIERRFLI